MGLIRRYWTILKLFFMDIAPPSRKIYDCIFLRYIKFKIRQYRLKTNEKAVVNTTYGPIKGVKRYSCWGDAFFSFEKIPFAKPPLDDLRFKAPQPPEPWTEVKDCTAEGPVPLQTNLLSKKVEGNEDCLYLNVYTKYLYPAKPYPVMVWIYGGGFESGGATKDMYSPDYFMQRDVVLISITYRVGPFGFLSFEDPSIGVPGNAGLKDQVLALKWVKENCEVFGGDSNNITIFGESAGGASVHYMMLTEQTKGLFHKGIIMSGSALCPWALLPKNNWAHRLAKASGFKGKDENDEKQIYEHLKQMKGLKLCKAEQNLLTKDEMMETILFPFGPIIEPYQDENTVLPEDPRVIMRTSWGKDLPLIIGFTSFEGLIFYLRFLSFQDPSIGVPGNAGLKDQVLALKWIKENCEAFGGDPNNITVFGESAGAASAHYMALTEQTKGLFHKIILQSGCAVCPWAKISPIGWPLRLAKLIGYNGAENNEQKVYEFLKTADGTKLAKAITRIVTKEERIAQLLFVFVPVIEPYITDDCVIPEDPRLMLPKAWSNNIPMITGFTSFEGCIMYRRIKLLEPFMITELKDFEVLVPKDLNLPKESAESKEIALKLKEMFFHDKEPSLDVIINYCNMLSYSQFIHSLYRLVYARLKYAPSAPTYLYRFDCVSSTQNAMKFIFCSDRVENGACHADDLCYMFASGFYAVPTRNSPEYIAVRRFLGSFVNFAESSDPNGPELQSGGVNWESVKEEDVKENNELKGFNLSLEKAEYGTMPENETISIWDNFYPKEILT